MSKTVIPPDYDERRGLDVLHTQQAIEDIKRNFVANLKNALNLTRVSAPLFVDPKTGLNDDLNNVERPVSFDIRETGQTVQVVHSLAKWKRYALYRYGFKPGSGLWTDMNAIRRDEELDNLHSIYVDQWDWEAILPDGCRNEAYLRDVVCRIAKAISKTAEPYKQLSSDVYFITSQQLEDLYPDQTPKQRENLLLKEKKVAFIMQIGDVLASGQKHDGRAPDYDDWTLNGDLMYYNEVLDCAFEVSSMGIRVDAESMRRQLEKSGCMERASLPFHQHVLDGTLPLTIGGGIGQSRLCMLILDKVHIGQVQASVWDQQTLDTCQAAGVTLL